MAYVKTKAQNMAADQCLCFGHINSIIPFLSKSDVAVQSDLCRTRLENPKTGFLMTWLIIDVGRLKVLVNRQSTSFYGC